MDLEQYLSNDACQVAVLTLELLDIGAFYTEKAAREVREYQTYKQIDEALQFENQCLMAYNKAQEWVSVVDLKTINGFVVLARMKQSLNEHPYVVMVGQKLEQIQEYVQPICGQIRVAADCAHQMLD